MDLLIDRSDKVVTIDNAMIDFDIGDFMPEHVELVVWNGFTYSGQIEYNDRPRLLENFQDILPFHPVVRESMRHLDGLTLTQAKQIQTQFMDSVAGSKSRMPIKLKIPSAVLPGNPQGERNWRALDIDIASAGTKTIPTIVGGATSGSGGSWNLITQINFYGEWLYLGIVQACLVTQWISPTGGSGSRAVPGVPYWGYVHPQSPYAIPWAVGEGGGGGDTGAGVENGGGSWPTINPPGLVDITLTETGTILQEIAKRTDALLKVFIRKAREVRALTTIQAVIDYNADVGWPS